MYPRLAGLDPSADEAPNHARTIQFFPWDHSKYFWDLSKMLGLLRPACLLLRNVSRVTQRDRVQLFVDVEPFLVPVVKRRVPWAVQVLGFHAIMEVEVYTLGYLQTTASFLPQTEKMAEKIEMGLEAAIRFAQVNKSGNKEDQVGM